MKSSSRSWEKPELKNQQGLFLGNGTRPGVHQVVSYPAKPPETVNRFPMKSLWECSVGSAALICPDKEEALETLSPTRLERGGLRTSRGIWNWNLQHKAVNFDFFPRLLAKAAMFMTPLSYLVFVRGITPEEMAATQSTKGTTTGGWLVHGGESVLDKLGLKWDKLTGVTTDACPNLPGGDVGLLKRIQDKVTETGISALRDKRVDDCILHQEVLC